MKLNHTKTIYKNPNKKNTFTQNKIIELDGDFLEGGGQIVRTALALSTLTQLPFKISNIRAGRKNPGLKAQHLHCIRALENLCDAKTKGANLGSTKLVFYPQPIKKKKSLIIDIKTAGSITLLLQSLLLPCFFVKKNIKLTILGGTDVKWSIPFNYFTGVIIPQLRKFCKSIDAKLIKRGFYPKGGGQVEISIKTLLNSEIIKDSMNVKEVIKIKDAIKIETSIKIKDSINIRNISDIPKLRELNKKIKLTNQGTLLSIQGISNASKSLEQAKVSSKQSEFAKLHLNKFKVPINIISEYSNSESPGSVITLWAIFSENTEDIDFLNPIRLGADMLGEKGKKAELIGEQVAQKLTKEINSKAPVDENLADNLIPWLALFGGEIKTSKISKHTLTNIYTTEKFLGKCFEINTKTNIIKTIF